MLEEYFIDCCAPTLAALKSASLFNCSYPEGSDPTWWIRYWNMSFHKRGLHLCVLRHDEARGTMLVYLFRISQMQSVLRCPKVRGFLSHYGYPTGEAQLYACIAHLKDRIALCDGFPHEIGIFLGYPLCDVEGFITHRGKNYKCLGPWKVYENEDQTRRTFEKYQKCRLVYTNLWNSGKRSVLQMTVAG